MRGYGTVGAPVTHCRALCWGRGGGSSVRCRRMMGAVVITVCIFCTEHYANTPRNKSIRTLWRRHYIVPFLLRNSVPQTGHSLPKATDLLSGRARAQTQTLSHQQLSPRPPLLPPSMAGKGQASQREGDGSEGCGNGAATGTTFTECPLRARHGADSSTESVFGVAAAHHGAKGPGGAEVLGR